MTRSSSSLIEGFLAGLINKKSYLEQKSIQHKKHENDKPQILILIIERCQPDISGHKIQNKRLQCVGLLAG